MSGKLLEILILASINAASVFLIIVVLANSFKDKIYRWFSIMTIFLIGWVDFAYLGYIEPNLDISILSYRINLAFVAAFFFAAYIFYIESFLKIKNNIFKSVLFIISSVYVFLSLLTDTIIEGAVKRDWGNEIHFGSLYPTFSIFAGIMAVIFVYYFISRYFTVSHDEKRKVKYFLIGTFIFIVFNITFNILTTSFLNTAEYQHFGDYSAIAFLAFTAYAMLKRQFLNVKVALAAFLISIISILLLIDIIALSNSLVEQAIKFLLFILFVAISIILLRSILNEIKQREELAEVNKELAESKALIQKRAQEQKDMIDVIAHEIRTPLTAIIQYIKLLKRTVLPKKEAILSDKSELSSSLDDISSLFRFVEIANPASIQMSDTTNTMLEYARIDNLHFKPTFEEFDLVPVVKDAIEVMKETVKQDQYSIRMLTKLDKLNISADKSRISEAIYALLSNAIKYGKNPDNEIVTIDVQLETQDGYVSIAVKDNGIGIAKEDIAKLGSKFVRLGDKTAGGLKRPGGTGIGLFVVQGIMQMHEGKLIIESKGVGKGSTFMLYFPQLNK